MLFYFPPKVPEALFWARYLFRIHVAREEETQRQLIRKEAQVRAQADTKGDDLNWDEGWLLVHAIPVSITYSTILLQSSA